MPENRSDLSGLKQLIYLVLGLNILPALAYTPEHFQHVADKLAAAINARDYSAIEAQFNSEMAKGMPLEKTTEFFRGLDQQIGKLNKLDPPRIDQQGIGVFPAHFERATLDLKIVLDAQGKIAGLWLLPHSPEAPVPEKNSTPLRLPFHGQWVVGWGGDTKEQNQHHNVPAQRFAFDLLGVTEKGETHTGDGKRNEDYVVFGREILAPADGTVVEVISGVHDNTPGEMNPFCALGNAVILQHSANEFSVFAHLKLDSIRVKRGEKISKGAVIALCGNSGNSSEPHLHYHLQNLARPEEATGIKCYFERVRVGNEKEARANYSPVKEDIISAD